jgi:hypothetical protein
MTWFRKSRFYFFKIKAKIPELYIFVFELSWVELLFEFCWVVYSRSIYSISLDYYFSRLICATARNGVFKFSYFNIASNMQIWYNFLIVMIIIIMPSFVAQVRNPMKLAHFNFFPSSSKRITKQIISSYSWTIYIFVVCVCVCVCMRMRTHNTKPG